MKGFSDEMVVTNIFFDPENMGVDTKIKLLWVLVDEILAEIGTNGGHFEFMQIRHCSTPLILVNFWNIVSGTIPNCIQVKSFLLQFVLAHFISLLDYDCVFQVPNCLFVISICTQMLVFWSLHVWLRTCESLIPCRQYILRNSVLFEMINDRKNIFHIKCQVCIF